MIRIEGLSLEKFLNMAAAEGIRVFDARRISYTVLRARLSAGGYRRLKALEADKYQITAEKSAGVPFGLAWLGRRKVLLIGMVMVAVAAFVASLFIWDIRVTGLEYMEEKALLEELEALGVRAGTYRGSINTEELSTQLIIRHGEFAWVNVFYRGVVLYAEVVPAEPVPEIIDTDRPCNIVAEKDAYIERIIARSGRAAVKVGDIVRKGDVLISGLIWDPGLPRMTVAARGEVIGSVWYAAKASAPLMRETRTLTGKTQTQRVITIGSDSAAVDGECAFTAYDTKVIDEYYIGTGLFLPVKVSVLEHSEVEITRTPAPLDTLKVYLEERAYYDAQGRVAQGVKTIGHRTYFDVQDDTLTAIVYLQTQEDIGKAVYLEE